MRRRMLLRLVLPNTRIMRIIIINCLKHKLRMKFKVDELISKDHIKYKGGEGHES